MNPRLDLSSLRSALASLDRGCARSRLSPDDEELRDAVIQRFEYTYELCWKMLRRRLEMDAAVPSDADRLSFPELLRAGAEYGMIADVERWLVYRHQRNTTSHVYDADLAWDVYRSALDFAVDARRLLTALEAHDGS